MAALSPVDDKFTVYVKKSCNPGPYLDPSKVESLPDFFQARTVFQTVANVLQAVVSAGFNFNESLDKVPKCLVKGVGVKIEITENKGDGGTRKKHHCRLQVLDRRSRGEMFVEKFVANLESCSKFLSLSQRICKECDVKEEELTSSKIEPTIKKEPTMPSLKTPKPKSQLTVYCRRNCKVGPLLDPNKIKKLSTSFSGSLPKIIKELVPAIILCGYNPNDVLKDVPSSQGGRVLVQVKIGRSNRMCLVRNVDSSVKFWNFIKKLCSAFGICENFFSEKQPKKSSCKKCRNTDFEADYYSSDDDDFQDVKGYKEIIRSIEKRKRTSIDKSTSAKKLKFADDSKQLQIKDLKVVVKRLPQDTVNYHLQRNQPRTPSKKQYKQVYLKGKKINIVTPRVERSPQKKLFPEASTSLSSPGEKNDDEAENMLNVNQERPQPGETTVEEMSIENDDENYLLETFLDQGVEDNNAELRALKEINEKMEEKNPLQGLFEKPEEQQSDGSGSEEELQEDESFHQYSSSFYDSQLFSPGSFFGNVLDSTEINSGPTGIEMEGIKSEPPERKKTKENYTGSNSSFKVGTENSKTNKEGEISSELQEAVKSNSIAPDETNDPHGKPTSLPECVSSEGTELEQALEISASSARAMDEIPISNNAPTTHGGSKENDRVDLLNSGDCFTNGPIITEKAADVDVPVPRRKINVEDELPFENHDSKTSENSESHNSSSPSILPSSNQNSVSVVSQSNNFASPSFPVALKALNTNNAVQSISSVATPQLQSLSVENFRTNASTSTIGVPQLPMSLAILSGSGMPSLPGNVSTSVFPVTNGTYSTSTTPVVSLPGNPPTNSSLPAQNDFNGILSPRLQPVHLPLSGNFSPSAYHGSDNVLSTDLSSVSLPGNFVPGPSNAAQQHMKTYGTSLLGSYSTNSLRANSNQQQFLQVDSNRNTFPYGPMNAISHVVQNTIQQPKELLMQKTSLTNISSLSRMPGMYSFLGQKLPQPFVAPYTNTGLCTPYSYHGLTNNVMANSLYPVHTPRYYPPLKNGNQTNQPLPLNNLSQVPATRYYVSSTIGPPADSSRTFLKDADVPISQPYSVTNHPSKELLNARHYLPSLLASYSVSKTNPSSVQVPTTSNHLPSATGHPTSQSVVGMNPSSVQVPTTRHYPPSVTGQPTSQSVVGMNPSSVQVPTTRHYQPSATGHPTSQSVVGMNPSSVQVLTIRQYPPSVTGQPTSQSFVGMNPSSVQVPTTRHYQPSVTGQPTSQSVVGMNPSSVQVPTTRHYQPSVTGQPTSQSVVGMNPSSVQVPTTRHYQPSVTGQPTSQSVVGMNPSSVKVHSSSGQPGQMLPLTSQPCDTRHVQISTNSAVSTIQNSTFQTSESNNITTGSITCNNNNTVEVEPSNEMKTILAQNPLAKTILAFLQRCEILPRERRMVLRQKLEQMLKTRRQRLAITHKDINDLEDLVGAEIKDESIFQDLIKLITAEPVLKDSAGVYHTIRNSENQGQQSIPVTTQGTAMMQSVINVEGTTAVTQPLSSDHIGTVTPSTEMESDVAADNGTGISDNGLECNNTSSMSDDDDVVIIDRPIEKQSLTSKSSMVNDQPKNDAVLNAVPSIPNFNSSLPKPIVQVSRSQGMTVLLWDLQDGCAAELVKQYELYAIQLEANEILTKDLIQSMKWKKIGIVNALPVPMAITLINLVEGLKNYMIVRAIGADGRVGPFSFACEVLGS